MSIFQKTFVFCTISAHQGKKCKKQLCSRAMQDKNKKQDEDITYFYDFDRMKWRHWVLLLLLILVTLTKMIPLWGVIYTTVFIPLSAASFAHLRHLSLCRGRYFHCSQHRLGRPHPIYEMGLRKKLARRFIFLAARAAAIRRKRRFSEG